MKYETFFAAAAQEEDGRHDDDDADAEAAVKKTDKKKPATFYSLLPTQAVVENSGKVQDQNNEIPVSRQKAAHFAAKESANRDRKSPEITGLRYLSPSPVRGSRTRDNADRVSLPSLLETLRLFGLSRPRNAER